jgi:predicted ABC-type ATPase
MHRLRVIAGPNGSGKTTLTKELRENYQLNFGFYLNADDIETVLRANQKISFRRFGIKVSFPEFDRFYSSHILRRKARVKFEIRYNTLYLRTGLTSKTYFPTLLADFIRKKLLEQKQTFSFETVMSGSDKLDLLADAKKQGYRIYLYFICIEKDEHGNPSVNLDRIRDRVEKKGHDVDETKVVERYYKTLGNLIPAIKYTDRSYLFDNSGTGYKLVGEITNGHELDFDPQFIPQWFEEFVLNKL